MKFGVVIFPGSNCDEDMIHVLGDVMGQQVERLWHKEHDLKGCDFIVLPGGFSFGDHLRSGAIARFSPIMQEVVEHCNKGGYAFGVCNGFQVLCEAELLPGTLAHNDSHSFICKNIHLKASTKNTILTSGLSNGALKIPIAHGEGKYFASSETIKGINDNDQVLFRYCNEAGEIVPEANPNGSIENIAGVCNEGRNVFGMMPHPERAATDVLGNTDGRALFESILQQVPA